MPLARLVLRRAPVPPSLARLAWATALMLLGSALPAHAQTARVERLRWDGAAAPMGILQFEPRLSWAMASDRRGARQSAYQVLVASTPARLQPGKADLWDSGKVESDRSLNLPYLGKSPEGRQRAWWTVRLWDERGRPTPFARPAAWEMGIYDEDWEGSWIGRPAGLPAPDGSPADPARAVTYLRKPFRLPAAPVRARIYASGFGVYELSANGRRLSDRRLAPGYTAYAHRVLFQAYDATAHLRKGDNVLGVVVAGGWCTAIIAGQAGACGQEPPRVMLQVEIDLPDGKRVTLPSDETWRAGNGPTIAAHLYDGEHFDARLQRPGWDAPGFDDRDWPLAQAYDQKIERDIIYDPGPPIVASDTLRAVNITRRPPATASAPDAYLFDFGQNLTGAVALEASAPAGTTVTLRHAEALDTEGNLDLRSLGKARATDSYTFSGRGRERWEPRFTLHTFRYVELSGLPGRVGADTLRARVIHSEAPETARLETSDPTVNRLFANAQWSVRNALASVPAARPASDHRGGELLPARAAAGAACLLRDVQGFYRKWIDDLRDAQLPDAAYVETAPALSRRAASPSAAMAGVLVPAALSRCHGDQKALDKHMASMGRFLDLVREHNPELVWKNGPGTPAGDPGEQPDPRSGALTDPTLIATAELAHGAEALAQLARAGGPDLASYAEKYGALAAAARAALLRAFVGRHGDLRGDTQGAYAFAIGLGLLPDDAQARAATFLYKALDRAQGRALTGLLGTPLLLRALSRMRQDERAYQVLLDPRCPGWACAVQAGATTFWERPDAWSAQRGLAAASDSSSGAAPSLNHHGHAALAEWMLEVIGGLALDAARPAGSHVLIWPRPGGGLRWARAHLDTPHGRFATDWAVDPSTRQFTLELTVPANARATVTLPVAGRAREGGTPLDGPAPPPGIRVISPMTMGRGAVLAVDSGRYTFTVEAPPAP